MWRQKSCLERDFRGVEGRDAEIRGVKVDAGCHNGGSEPFGVETQMGSMGVELLVMACNAGQRLGRSLALP